MRIDQMSVEEVEQLILESLEKGINFFDLADIYGNGRCEELFGMVLKRNPELRSKIYLQTKVGIILRKGYDSSYQHIIQGVEDCIKRLECGYLDCILIHRPDIFMDNEEVAKAIHELYSRGLIKDFGVSNFSSSQIEYLKTTLKLPIKYNQVQLGLGNMSMIEQTFCTNVPDHYASKEEDSLYFYLKKNNIAIQCWSPFQMGFFEGCIFDQQRYPKLNEVLDKYALKYHTSKCAIATAFLLVLNKSIMVITGSTSLKHIQECLDGEKIDLTKEDWYHIYQECGYFLP